MGTVIGFTVIGGITILSVVVERRLLSKGYTRDAKSVQIFGRFFLIGCAVYIAYSWAKEALLFFV
ncbi:hypothetical protein L1N85_10610 [Paenibacillus alkaliterrae]|uniref:hypothetical protein n=1 Tax=Paenibacillus alkaliterrae TaxID=320909 RepID=UPI001F3C7385|nr:hypothetical protein [Paenibacillus alkaliterrae]MCF2938887.1 hypothetical protein [Paenibacillus alkaliterrae]